MLGENWQYALALFALVWAMPSEWLPIDNINPIQHRLLALFVLAASLWVLEPVPVFATSIFITTLLLVMLSNKGLGILVSPYADSDLLIDYNKILAALSSPIVILFLGGFSLALPPPNMSWT